MWVSWLEHCHIYQKVAGSIPSQGTHPGFGLTPGCSGCGKQLIDVSFSAPLPLYKINKKKFQ